MTSSLTVPLQDAGDFADLKDEIRSEVRKWLRSFAALVEHHNGRTPKGTKIGDVIDKVAIELRGTGVSKASSKTVRRKWDAFKDTITTERPCGDWRVFINRAKCPVVADALPKAFVEFWKGLCQQNQRKCAPAYRALVRKWNRGEPIPGYECEPTGQPLADEATGVPPGWTFRNLLRHKPTKLELKAARQGLSAARAHLPLIRLTRVGLNVGQYYLFDDLWHDFKVAVPGQRVPQRLLQFHALDLFSGCNIARGYKPILENDATGLDERLKEREMLFLVCCVLARDGYREDGTVLVVEHGTAAIREEFEKRIFDLTGGKVRVERSEIKRASAFAGQYFGQSKGNFRFKAALESFGNLLHNETANMLEFPGQTGSNSRVNAPEELYGREKSFVQLARAIVALGPERGNLLRLPFLDYNKAARLVDEVHERINQRVDHDLEGWKEAGLTMEEFRLGVGNGPSGSDQPWLPLAPILALPDEQRLAVEAVISQPNLSRVRNLSPREVWNRGAAGLTRLDPFNVPQLLGPDFGEERKVRSQMFEFESKDLSQAGGIGSGAFRYLAKVKNRFGGEVLLKDGEIYKTFVNPLNPEELHVCNAGGGYLGTCERWTSVTRGDTEKLNRQIARAQKVHTELLAPVAARGAAMTRERLADIRRNIKVLKGAPITAEEKSKRKELRRDVASITDEDREAVSIPVGRDSVESDDDETIPAEAISHYFGSEEETASTERNNDDSTSS